MIGKTISHYKILEEIGSGGMGIVYKAEDSKLKRTVALKFLPSEFSRDKEAKKRFLYEAQAAAAIEHQNICPIYEINEDDGQLFIVMSYLEGVTLRDRIERGPLGIEEFVKIVAQIAEGLQEAHENNIIHRDIKSANIFITKKNVVKILDFGLAKLRGHTKLTKESTTLGTVAYMSPEQTTGETVDHRSDIWSLGVVFYEMITGQLPFKGHYEQAIVYSILNEEPGAISQLIEDIPPDLEQIINKMLAKDPSQRYMDLSAFLEDLKRFKKGKDLKEITVKPKFKITPRPLVLGVILLAVIIGAFFIFKGKAKPDIPPVGSGSMPSLAVVYFENKSGEKNLDNWREAFSELLTTDLSQSRYIKVLRSDEVYGIFKKLNLLEAKRYSAQDLKDVAEKGKVNHVLKGSYIKAGDNFVITAMLINADSGDTISSLSVRAEGEKNIFPKIDELTREIKSKLKLTNDQIAGDIDTEIGQITTSSPEALQYYLEGRRYLKSGESQKSIACMKKAIEIDPEFAMAYRSLAVTVGPLGYEWRPYSRKAMEFSHRLPDRERYIIQGDFYWNSDKTKASEAYKKVLQLYPNDLTANTNLGNLYANLEEWDNYIERNEVLIRNNPEDPGPYTDIALCFQCKGMYEKARETLEAYLNNFKDDWIIRKWLAITYCLQRKFDRALIEIDRAISLAPKRLGLQQKKGEIYFCGGDFYEAEKIFQELLESPFKPDQIFALYLLGHAHITRGRLTEAENHFKQALNMTIENKMSGWQHYFHEYIGYIYFIRGKYESCLEEFGQALDITKEGINPLSQIWGLYFTAKAYLEKKSWDQVGKAEAELQDWALKRTNKKLIRWYYLFKGQKELKKKNPSGAIEYLEKALSFLYYQNGRRGFDQVLFFDALARAYLEAGQMEKAQHTFEKITRITYGRFETGDIYARAFYNLGKIYQRKDWKGKAIENYKKFIELWKECDPIFQPLVSDARERVKDLAHSSQPPAPSQE